jgi:hypothetical protein
MSNRLITILSSIRCYRQTGVHRMGCGSTAFLFSYLRKRPDTYRQEEIHSIGLNPILDHLGPIQLEAYSQQKCSRKVRVFIQKPPSWLVGERIFYQLLAPLKSLK